MKKICVLLSLLFVLASCGENTKVETETEQARSNLSTTSEQTQEATQQVQEKIIITSSIIPISSVINAIGQEFVEVDNIIPAGVSPHGFDMSVKQRARLEDAQLVFMTGLDHIDGFLEKSVSDDVQVHLADGMELIEIEAHDHDSHEDEHGEDEHEDHEGHDDEDEHHDGDHDSHDEDEHEGEHHDDEEHSEDEHDDHSEDEHDDHSSDPHVWLGKDNIISIAKNIESELAQKLPTQAVYFAENRQKFEAELNTIYDEFVEKTAGKNPQEFIVFHDAYNYLFESINLDSNLKIPFSDNVLHDTGTAHMAELIDEIKLHDIKHIFKEPQFSDTNINTLVDEFTLGVYTLDPLGTDPSAEGYLANLRNNLDSLINIYE